MKKFNAYFIEQLILCIIIFGIGFTVLIRAITALVINQTEPSINGVAYPVVWIGHLLNAVCMVVSIFVAQKNAQKKECIDTPLNPMKYYLIVCTVLVVVNILFAVFGFRSTCETCINNIDVVKIAIERQGGLFTTPLDEIKAELVSKISGTVLIAVIIGNILQAVIIFGFTPVYVKNHEKLFCQ
ncbi:MAG: hypothetical protein IJJ69_00580 [Oscillospiraceae bacterium]|nr:hypothetical protein [Oscillospiraceae bacterium]